MTAGIADPRRLPILRQQRLDPPLDEGRVVLDEGHLPDVDLLGDEREQVVVERGAPLGERDPDLCEGLAGLEAGRPAQRPGQLDRPLGAGHRAFQVRVAVTAEVTARPAGQVHAVGFLGLDGGHEVPVHDLGEERQDRGEHPGRGDEGLVQRRECRRPVGAVRGA